MRGCALGSLHTECAEAARLTLCRLANGLDDLSQRCAGDGGNIRSHSVRFEDRLLIREESAACLNTGAHLIVGDTECRHLQRLALDRLGQSIGQEATSLERSIEPRIRHLVIYGRLYCVKRNLGENCTSSRSCTKANLKCLEALVDLVDIP